MTNPFRKPAPEAKPTQETQLPIQKIEAENPKITKSDFEDLCNKLIDYESVIPSPITGELIATIRTEDVFNTIADFFKINIEETYFSEYKK